MLKMTQSRAKQINIFRGVAGLNTKQHPVSLTQLEEGIIELAEAVNIDISNRFKPYRRPGQVSTSVTMPGHSFYGAGDFGLFVSGTSLMQLSNSFGTTTVRSGLTANAPMSYTEQAGKIFYANGHEKGYIQGGSHSPWVAPESPNTVVDSSRNFSSPPVGHKLITAFGRIFIAQNNVLWFTEPFAPFLVDMARNAFMFDSNIREIIAVADGLFVSTNTKIVFLAGANVKEMTQLTVAEYPIIPGTVARTDSLDMPDIDVRGIIHIATTSRGICVFGNNGNFQNLSNYKVDLPTASKGSAYIYKGKYVVNLQ